MALSMLLAHLVGDYVLQWNSLAMWKSREVKGALVHGLIVLLVTVLACLPFNPAWWLWALFIGLSHMAVDAVQPWLKRIWNWPESGGFALLRLFVDQAIHLSLIGFALIQSGYLALPSLEHDLSTAVHTHRLLAFVVAYVFIATPAWILIEFIAYGLITNSVPDFEQVTHYKYIGTLERWLIATFVLLGQFSMASLVLLPRLLFEGPQVVGSRRAMVYLTEILANAMLALAIGLFLRQL